MPDYYNYDQNSGQQPMYNPPQYQPQAGMEPPPGYVQKSRVAAGILAILMGTYGIHSFYLGKNSRVRYVEKHYSEGDGSGERILNPTTNVYMEEGSSCEMEMVQLRGVTSTVRDTNAELGADAKLVLTEKLLTHGNQTAISNMKVELKGEGSSVQVISRSVAQDDSVQVFNPLVIGECACRGHVQCDAIIMGNAKVKAIPGIEAASEDAMLVHEAAIGKIAGDQIIKLMTLGLTEEEAEQEILEDFLN